MEIKGWTRTTILALGGGIGAAIGSCKGAVGAGIGGFAGVMVTALLIHIAKGGTPE